MVEKTCALDGCENPVPDGRKDRRFCTPDHMKESRKRAARYAVEPRPCERCGQMIEKPYSGNQKYHRDTECWYEARKDNTRAPGLPTTRRCRNKLCIERFVPVNPQHWYHEPGCQQSELLWSVEEILAEEGALLPGGNHLEMAKAAFGQKNQALRENTRLRSLRDYLTFEVQSFHDEHPEYRYPKVTEPPKVKSGPKKPREIIIQLSDWQIGKWEQGFGWEATKRRIEDLKRAVAEIIQRQRDAGFPVKRAHVSIGGDGLEGCYIYRGQNVSGLDKTGNTHRLTVQIYRLAHEYAEFALFVSTLVDQVEVECVPGNHGRPNGPSDYADKEDNFDTMACWWARDLTANTKRIKWNISEDFWHGFESAGHHVVSFHGDQWNGPLERLETLMPQWISTGVFGGKPDLVLTHHRHTRKETEIAGIPTIQNSTIDGGSRWYLTAYGKASRPAQNVIVMAENYCYEAVFPVFFSAVPSGALARAR